MNLDRSILIDVTSKISLAPNSQTFKPVTYGITQRLIFTLDLSKASSIFNYFLLIQTVDITLRGPANNDSITTAWDVNNNAPSLDSIYGLNINAKIDRASNKYLYIDNNLASLDDFINTIYRKQTLYTTI